MMNGWKSFLLVISVLFTFCNTRKANDVENTEKNLLQPDVVDVAVYLCKKNNFNNQIICNGKILSEKKVELKFKINGIIEQIYVHNGKYIEKGKLVAKLENQHNYLDLLQAQHALAEAEIMLNTLIVDYSGKYGDTTSIPTNSLHFIKTKSGYNKALINLKVAEYNYNSAFIYAPISGIISDLKTQNFNSISANETLCNIIDNNNYIIEFYVMESELDKITLGQAAEVKMSLSDTNHYKAQITEINPAISKDGLCRVRAKILQHSPVFIEGRNAIIINNQMIPDQVVVPKDAVIARSGRQVVFTYKNGLARWNYVKISGENIFHYAISEGLKLGDTVIVDGNISLIDESKVKIKSIIQ